MNKMYNLMKMFPLWAVCTFLCLTINVSAQTPVGAEFYGQWTLNKVQAQERPLNSQGSYTERQISVEDLKSHICFYGAPLAIAFMEGGETQIETPQSVKGVKTIFTPDNGNMLQVVENHEIEGETVEGVTATYFNLDVNGNTLSLQCLYFYGIGEGNDRTYTEGILTIQYNR